MSSTVIDEVPRAKRLVYASHSFGSSFLSRTTMAWLIFFYAPPPAEDAPTIVPRITLTTILLVLGILDGINDPLIGYWSDRTQSRWGRRIPFIVLATPFYGLFWFLLWTPLGQDGGYLLAAAYFTIIMFLQRISATLSGGPMEALLPEVARTSAARVSNVAWQFVFGSGGAVAGLVLTGIIIDLHGFVVMAAVVAIAATSSRYLGLFGVWRYVKVKGTPVRLGIRESLRQVVHNDQFRLFLPTFIFFNMAIMLLTAALPFYADVVILGDRETLDLEAYGTSVSLSEGSVSSLLFATAILAVLLALPIIYRLAVWRGKAWVYKTAMLSGAIIFPMLFFMGFLPGVHPLIQSLVFVALAGMPMVGVFTFPNAIIADIIDYDAVRTGLRREAIYYGTQNVLEKWTGSLMFPIFGVLLLFGETVDDPLGIRLMGPVAGVAAFIGYLFFRGYRLPDSVTREGVQSLLQTASPSGGSTKS